MKERINKITKNKILTKYSIITQLHNRAKFNQLILQELSHTKEYLQIQHAWNWIDAIIEIGKSVKIAVLFSSSIEETDKIIEEYKLLLQTL